jgi:hypothetical protein
MSGLDQWLESEDVDEEEEEAPKPRGGLFAQVSSISLFSDDGRGRGSSIMTRMSSLSVSSSRVRSSISDFGHRASVTARRASLVVRKRSSTTDKNRAARRASKFTQYNYYLEVMLRTKLDRYRLSLALNSKDITRAQANIIRKFMEAAKEDADRLRLMNVCTIAHPWEGSADNGSLTVAPGQLVAVLEKLDNGWWVIALANENGELVKGSKAACGVVPSLCVDWKEPKVAFEEDQMEERTRYGEINPAGDDIVISNRRKLMHTLSGNLVSVLRTGESTVGNEEEEEEKENRGKDARRASVVGMGLAPPLPLPPTTAVSGGAGKERGEKTERDGAVESGEAGAARRRNSVVALGLAPPPPPPPQDIPVREQPAYSL